MHRLLTGILVRPLVAALFTLIVAGCVTEPPKPSSAPHPDTASKPDAAVASPGIVAATPQSADPGPVISLWRVYHRRTGQDFVRVAGGDPDGSSVQLAIVIDPTGAVRSAKATEGFAPAFAAAEAQAMHWRYTPYLRGGRAVSASFEDSIKVLPPEAQPTRHVRFPEVTDQSRVRIRLERSGCYGSCPAYSVEIGEDGAVTYEGMGFVLFEGRYETRIPRQAVTALIDKFRQADFFSLNDKYFTPVTDVPSYNTSLEIDGQLKSVDDYWGVEAGMPGSVVDLENEIDRVAGTDRWVHGSEETIALLKAEGFDFHSVKATTLLATAVGYEKVGFVRGLLAEGISLNALAHLVPDGSTSVLRSAGENDEISVVLIEAALQRGTRMDRTQALGLASSLGDVSLIRRLLARGADVNGDLGEGRTPLMRVYSAEAVRVLIRAGARVNARTRSGDTPLLSANSEDAALALLAAGADPKAEYSQGVSLVDRAKREGWTRLLAKLDALQPS
jgi:hypothetical protein